MIKIIFTPAFALTASISQLIGQVADDYSNSVYAQIPKVYPFQMWTYTDGGTKSIYEKKTRQWYCIDYMFDSKTIGHLYVGGRHPGSKGAKLLPRDQALKILEHIESALVDFHGKEGLEIYRKILSNPEKRNDEEKLQLMKQEGSLKGIYTEALLREILRFRERFSTNKSAHDNP
jgi:hypothetical protein